MGARCGFRIKPSPAGHRCHLACTSSWAHRLLPILLGAVLAAAGALNVAPARAAEPDGKALYIAKNCHYCHGEDGRTSRRDTFPIVAGQMPRYSYLVMRAYKSGERQGVAASLMWEVADVLTDEEMKLLAEYMATLK